MTDLQLPPLSNLDDETSMKQHVFSEKAHWVIPGKLMAGGNPIRGDDTKKVSVKELDGSVTSIRNAHPNLSKIIEEGKITTFVNLQSEVNIPKDAENLGGKNDGHQADEMPDYSDTVASESPEAKIVYYGMEDDNIVESTEELQSVIENLVEKLSKENEVLYVHCKGGSGRTGIITACLLGRMYPDLSADEVLERTQKYFEMRAKGAGKWVNPKYKSPATEGQKEQVKEILSSAITIPDTNKADEGNNNGGGCVMM